MDKKPKILIVDDDPAMRKMAGKLLESSFDVSAASSGSEALKMLADGLPARLVLLDIDMPDMDGFQTKERMAENPHFVHIPVIFLTAMTDTENEIRGFALGAKDFVRKPFHRDILRARIAANLEEVRVSAEHNVLDEEKLAALPQPLTNVELKVARLIAKGYSNKEIMAQLYYSEPYVKKLAARVFGKLGIDRRTKIVEYFK